MTLDLEALHQGILRQLAATWKAPNADKFYSEAAKRMYRAGVEDAAQVVIEPFFDALADEAKDEARYRWLREHWFAMGTMANSLTAPGCWYHNIAKAADVETLDAAIDAAIAAEGKP